MANKYYYGVGRRKTSSATVRIYKGGKGNVTLTTVNIDSMKLEDYFKDSKHLIEDALFPFYVLDKGLRKEFDITINVKGWWVRGQAEAIRLWIARALIEYYPERRNQLKPYGLLKRDDRSKERKKPWLLKARKSPQWSKR